jgi:hypothetical protein
MGLVGDVESKPITIAIFNHSSSYGFPTAWHARGYGLFAANPIGRHGYDPQLPVTTLMLQPGKSAAFRFRLVVRDAHLTREELQKEYERIR